MNVRFLLPIAFAACNLASAEPPATARLPKLNDPALKIEALCSAPEIEAPATVAAAPDGSFYVGCDPRDTRLNTKEPVCSILRFSSMGADKKRTVFADKLYSPAGSLWHEGWLYVIHDPLMTRFKDTDGDGVADVREDLVTNLGLVPYDGINDHVVSGFTLGMDGLFYISVGDRGIHQAKSVRESQAAEKGGKAAPELSMEGGGVIRCRPDGTQLEVFSTGTRNHLSVLLDADDNVFTRDNTDDGNGWWTRVTHHIEGGYYGYPYDYQSALNNGVTAPSEQTKATARGGKGGITAGGEISKTTGNSNESPVEENLGATARPFLPAMADFGGGSPTGGICYLSDGLPEQYRGKLLFSEWGKSTLFATEVARDGATFKLVKDTPLVQSDGKVDFRPMEVSIANDGSLLIADWGWGGWKADRVAGTIWRVSWPEAKPAPRLRDESKATLEELIAALGHPDRGQRMRAQWELASRGESTAKVAKDPNATALQRSHALWTLEIASWANLKAGTDPRPVASAARQIIAEAAGARGKNLETRLRGQAIRALGQSGEFYDVAMSADDDLETRRHALAALARSRDPEPDVASAMARGLNDENPWIRTTAGLAFQNPKLADLLVHQVSVNRLSAGFLNALATAPTVEGVKLLGQVGAGTLKRDLEIQERSEALITLGDAALLPKPYDGKWWGTQPAKNPKPLPSATWEGTAEALGALTTALGADSRELRTAAAKAFTRFSLAGDSTTKETSLAALRSRLQTEKDGDVRLALIEALAIQRDSQAMRVFTSIALDELSPSQLRRSVIAAITAVGGDEAKRTVAQLAGAKLDRSTLIELIGAAAKLKVAEAAPALIGRLKEGDIEVREKVIRALASIGSKGNATAAMVELLGDKEERIRMEAMNALASLKDKAALAPLLALAQATRPGVKGQSGVADHERGAMLRAIGALADASAIPVLLEALKENAGRRRDALKPLKSLSVEAWPRIEAQLASGELPPELEAEIRANFESGVIAKWKILGPFENVWSAVHPPESDALAARGAVDLSRKYINAEGKDAAWREVSGEGEQSAVDLGKIFQSNGMVCAYAYAEIEASDAAEVSLLCGSDDQIAIWINGEKVHDVAGSRGFEPDKDKVPIKLVAGTNRLLLKIGNQGGQWEFAARVPGLQGMKYVASKEPAPELKQRAFALATKVDGSWVNSGDPAKGSRLFHDSSAPMGAICATCHIAEGKGGLIGPNLNSVGTNYKRADLITSIHEPGKTIALGFEQVMLETTGGEIFVGSLRQDAAETLTLVGADGLEAVVNKADVKSRKTLEGSLMPPGLAQLLKPEEFADLLAYLESLHGK